jgi:hypothetical protein
LIDIHSDRRRQAQGGVVQTEKDGEIVDWLGRLGAAGAEHVMARFQMGRSWAYARLSSLVRDGLLEQKQLLHRQPGLYVATAEGLRWQGLQRLGVNRLSVGGFEHARRAATAAVALHLGLPGWTMLSERELRVVESECDELVASARLGELAGGRPALHRPDVALISPQRRVLAVEIELSVKAPRRLQAICRGYARARHISHVYYLANRAAARAVSRAVAASRSQDRITVLALDDTEALVAGSMEDGRDGS